MADGLDAVLERIRASVPATGRALVAIDGIGGSGKTTFTRALLDRIADRPVVLLRTDDFFNPPAVRHARGRLSPEGFWLDAYDSAALRSRALEPLRRGDARYRGRSGGDAPLLEAPVDALVVIEGVFLHRDELRGYWDCSVFLDVPFAVATSRMVARGTVDGPDDPRVGRYVGAQERYFAEAQPWMRASLIVDNTGGRPEIVDPVRHASAGPEADARQA